MKITGKVARAIVWEEADDFELVEGTREVTDTSRWSNHFEAVFRDLSSGLFYKIYWSEGATEDQPNEPFEGDDDTLIDVPRVKLTTVTRKEWVIIPKG